MGIEGIAGVLTNTYSKRHDLGSYVDTVYDFVLGVIGDLEDRLGGPLPEARRPLELIVELRQALLVPDVAKWLAEKSPRGGFYDLTGADIVAEVVKANSIAMLRDVPGLHGLVCDLLQRSCDSLGRFVRAWLDALEPQWDAASAIVREAIAAGVRPGMTAEQVIDAGDEAVAAFRKLVADDAGIATLDALWGLRTRLLLVAGCHVAADERALAGRHAWLTAFAGEQPLAFVLDEVVAAKQHERKPMQTRPVDEPTDAERELAEAASPIPDPELVAAALAGADA